jgi:hypothetical protein
MFLISAASFGAATSLLGAIEVPTTLAAPPVSTLDALPGLPPTQRLVPLACSECGAALGLVLLDEFDAPDQHAVCPDCYAEAETDAEAHREAAYDDDNEDLSGELEELQDEHDDLQAKHLRLLNAVESVRWQLRDLEETLRPGDPRLARVAERSRDLLEAALPLA